MSHILTIDDPDLRQSIEDFRGTVAQIRALSARAITLDPDSPTRRALEGDIQRYMSDISLRANERHQMSADALVALINDDLDSRARRGAPPPARPTIRTVTRDLTEAQAREATARAQLSAAQIELRSAATARAAAEERLEAYAGRAR